MPMGVHELKAVSTLIARATQFVQDALTVAEMGADIAVQRSIKPLLARARDVQTEIDGRLKAAEREDKG